MPRRNFTFIKQTGEQQSEGLLAFQNWFSDLAMFGQYNWHCLGQLELRNFKKPKIKINKNINIDISWPRNHWGAIIVIISQYSTIQFRTQIVDFILIIKNFLSLIKIVPSTLIKIFEYTLHVSTSHHQIFFFYLPTSII